MKNYTILLIVTFQSVHLAASTTTLSTQGSSQNTSDATIIAPINITKAPNAAPAAFPVCMQAFKMIYDGTLAIADAQLQSWYTSYDLLYKEYNGIQNSDSNVLSLLKKLKTKTITPTDATKSFATSQQTLINQTNALLSRQ